VFVCIFYPKDHLKKASNELVLEAIYRLMNGYSINYALIMLNYMYQVANMCRTPLLPYSNILPCIFIHFKVPLDLEDCVTQPVLVISAQSLKTLRFYKIKTRGWPYISYLTPKEASALMVTLLDPTPSPNVADALVALKDHHTELRTQLDHIQMSMGLMNQKIDALIRLASLICST